MQWLMLRNVFQMQHGRLENFNWATTHEEAENLLDDFIERFLVNYGAFPRCNK